MLMLTAILLPGRPFGLNRLSTVKYIQKSTEYMMLSTGVSGLQHIHPLELMEKHISTGLKITDLTTITYICVQQIIIKEVSGMEAFIIKLNNVADSYYGFVAAVLTYVKNKESRLGTVEEFMNNNPSALTSDILEFISDQKDFYEDAAGGQAEAV